MPTEKFKDFNNIHFLKDTGTDVGLIWQKLLKFLNNENEKEDGKFPYWDSFLQGEVFGTINQNADLLSSNEPSGFYQSIWKDMTNALEPIPLPIQIDYDNIFFNSWFNRPWNDSIAKTMIYYYFSFDQDGAKQYEDDSLYINEDGTIDTIHSHGMINISNSDVKMRISDIRRADAGNSFGKQSSLWTFVDYITDFNFVLTYKEWTEDGEKKIEYYDIPLILKVNRENFLRTYPELYTEIFEKDMSKGTKRNDIIDCLNGTLPTGWLYSDIINFIDKYHIEYSGEETYQDIKNTEGYYYARGYYEEKSIKLRKLNIDNLWVIPWYNINGDTYSLIRNVDLKLSVMSYGIEDDTQNINKGKYFLDFTREYNKEESKWMRLLMPQYKRKVEVEDLNRNFWVIAQTLSSIMAFLFDPEAPYPKMIGNILNEIMQIWENILFIWGELAANSKKHYDTITKVVYISHEKMHDYLSYDDFDFYDIVKEYGEKKAILSVQYQEQSSPRIDVINLIPILYRNQDFEDYIIKYLREYRKKFANKNVNLIPVIRLDNYENNAYKRIICPGIYRYFINYKDLEEKISQDVISPPSGEMIDNVFRTDTHILGEYNPTLLNCYEESFMAIVKQHGSMDSYYYTFDISTEGFDKIIAGIYEKETQDGYGGINYLIASEKLRTANLEKVYGLIKPIIKATSHNDVNDNLYGAEKVDFRIEAYDLAKYFIETGNKIDENGFIKNKDYVIYRGGYSDNNGQYESIDDRENRKKIYKDGVMKLSYTNNIDGIFGYYLGELLSEKRNSSQLDFNVITLNEKELQPTWIDREIYINQYGRPNGEYPEIYQDENDDKLTLINSLKNVYDRWRFNLRESEFWESRQSVLENSETGESWTPNGEIIRVGYKPDTMEELTFKRSDVYYSYDDGRHDEKVWGNKDGTLNEELWKSQTWNQLKDVLIDEYGNAREDMTESTILFVVGTRTTGWKDNTNKKNIGSLMFAKDGLIHWKYPDISGQKVTTGAAIRLPIGQGDAEYGFYSLHANPTAPDEGYDSIAMNIGMKQFWREENQIDGQYLPINGCMMNDQGEFVDFRNKDNGEIDVQILDEYYKKYKTKTLFVPVEDSFQFRYEPSSSWYAVEDSQYFVLRKEEDETFNDNNWLVEKIDRSGTPYVLLYSWRKGKKNRDVINLPLSDILDSNADTEIKARFSTKALESIDTPIYFLEEYYKHTYQKYVYNILRNWTEEEKKTKTLADAFNEFNLINLLFGWLRIMDRNGNEIITYKMPYNNPKKYTENTPNDLIEIIDKMREKDTFGGEIINGKATPNSSISFEELQYVVNYFNNGQYIGLENCIFMGSFCQKYSGSPPSFDRSDIGKAQVNYYEDRIMGAKYGIGVINQLELIYRNQKDEVGANVRTNFVKAMNVQFNMHKELWYDSDTAIMYQKIARWITPQDNDENLREEYTFSLELPNSAKGVPVKIILKDKILCDVALYTKIENYVFGPEIGGKYLYARRGVYRYPLRIYPSSQKEIEMYNLLINGGDEKFGNWPVRPVNRQSNAETSWKDDYYITGEDIDNLRQGYAVIYNTLKGANFEKYKSRGFEEHESYYNNNRIGAPRRDDDEDKPNIWDYPEGG